MCGRTCLTLDPNQIICACKYKTTKSVDKTNCKTKEQEANTKQIKETDSSYLSPEWRPEFNCGRKFISSYNVAPTDITPVLVSTDHFSEDNNGDYQSRVLVPMMWGMIPFWHKGDYRKHGLSTNNCRLEHMLSSKLYRGPFRRGQRCVVLCEGFYEWQTTKTTKPSERAAFLIHMPQKEGIIIYDKTTWIENINLLKMAGLFDVWEDDNGDKIYSYSVITFESSSKFNWMHHRMPAILENEQQINDWLDFKRVTDEQALNTLQPAKEIIWYQVSNLVNNSRNKSDQCNKPIDLAQKQKLPTPSSNKTLLSWLNVRKRREDCLASENEEKESNDSEDEGKEIQMPKRQKFSDYKKTLTKVDLFTDDEKKEVCDENSAKAENNK
ncbi:abasic site processing protein HMCES [Teleopsis dalmanni]|uniref:abasic site processing protein HMCES n=1 Tax=Teleopsis dalmanni TaxID=139649 RepID=UPI0018CED32F|nr:abasic site processing protein HMCES [Teleopsis dalmanni]